MNSSHLLFDCHLLPFIDWLTSRGLQSGVHLRCHHPVALRGSDPLQLAREEFVCDPGKEVDAQINLVGCFMKKVICFRLVSEDLWEVFLIEQPQTTIGLRNGTVQLHCAAASSFPHLQLFWRKDNVFLSSVFEQGSNFTHVHDDRVTVSALFKVKIS